MCGLVCVVAKYQNGFTKNDIDAFTSLMFIDQLRGRDSTGIFSIGKTGDLRLAKEASGANEFLANNDVKELLTHAYMNSVALVGHNRFATKGKITDENAHPFVVEDTITLVHNGTLYGDYDKFAKVDVDSHALAHALYQNQDNLEKAFQEITGAIATIFFNSKKQTLNIVRNAQRPLWFVETTSSYIWASEKNFLDWILSRYPEIRSTGNPTHEIGRAVGDTVRIVPDAVRSQPNFATLFREYHKYLAGLAGGLLGL